MKKRKLSQSQLKEVLHYNEETGIFVWKKCPTSKSRVKIGAVAGSKISKGYIVISIFHVRYLAHHLAWFYVYGEWPFEIDHKDRVSSNNRIKNLRLATRTQNNANIKTKSKFKGVFRASKNSYRASIQCNGIVYPLGHFDAPEKAHAAYLVAAKKHFGEFARG